MSELDVVVSGLVFQDLVLRPAHSAPSGDRGVGHRLPGESRRHRELRRRPGSAGSADRPGRGLRRGSQGDRVWDSLTAEGIDLTLSRKLAGWQTPLTVALAYADDRALVTRGTPPLLSADELITAPPAARAVAAHIGPWPNEWLAKAKAAGSVVFADVGWDPSEQWDPAVLDQLEHCDVFLPNADEAMRYTRTSSPEQALDRLAELVPLVVVSNGADGALAIDAGTGERVVVPAYQVPAADTTGAGDVFAAGFIAATLWELPLEQRVRFAALTAALSVTRLGGADAAPRWADLAAWQAAHPEDHHLQALISAHSGR